VSRVVSKRFNPLPTEVHVRSHEPKDSLDQLMGSFGVKLHVAKQRPAVDQARAHLLGFIELAAS